MAFGGRDAQIRGRFPEPLRGGGTRGRGLWWVEIAAERHLSVDYRCSSLRRGRSRGDRRGNHRSGISVCRDNGSVSNIDGGIRGSRFGELSSDGAKLEGNGWGA